MIVVLRYFSIFTLIAALILQMTYLRTSLVSQATKCAIAVAENLTYKVALDQVAVVTFTDKSGAIIEVNDYFCKLSGYKRCELIGQNHRIMKSGHHPIEFYKDIWKTLSSGMIWRGEICNVNKNGELYWVDSSLVPYFDADKKIEKYCSIRFDITKRKLAEIQMLKSQKMSSLGEMSAGLAHEINTPMGIVQLRLDQLAELVENNDKEFDRKKARESLADVNKTINRISKIIQGLSNFSRDSKNDSFVEYSVNAIVKESFDLCQEKLKSKDIKFDYVYEKDINIKCRPTEIAQVLLNLMNNSIHAIENLSDRWIEIRLNLLADQDIAELSVKDSGSGIPKEIHDKIMQPFFTTKELGKGTGIGLSISQSIINAHKGEISVDTKCLNTRFVIKLPVYT